MLTALVLIGVDAVMKRKKREIKFPHHDFQEVRVGNNHLQLFTYGQDLYNAMFAAIEGAQKYIYLESFIWKNDEIGYKFRDLLAQKAHDGVDVYVIFDSFGNMVVPQSFKEGFDPAIHLLAFQAFRRPWYVLDLRRYALDHRKLLIVDSEVGFVGGYNIGALYATQWRDTHLRLRGPVASDLGQSFADFWNRSQDKEQQITQRHRHHFDPLITINENESLDLTFPIRDMYISAINKAEEHILLTTAYFIPDHILLSALKAAARRGVNVRILLPWSSNHVVSDWISRSYFMECLEAGIHILGYKDTMLHAKTCTIDEQWSTVGTANMDRLSLVGNYEINLEIFNRSFAQQMQKLFESDSKQISELTADNWRMRPWYIKASEHILKPWRFFM
jgi:cardiolipin synthase